MSQTNLILADLKKGRKLSRGRNKVLPPLRKGGTLIDYFEARYIPEPNSGCWLWIGAASDLGYGWLKRDGVKVMATHVSLRLAGRPAPVEGLYACHRCDNPHCVNPEHLFWGTQRDNIHDAMRKGRANFSGLVCGEAAAARLPHHKGEGVGTAKLTEAAVLSILEDDRSSPLVASAFGVSQTAIKAIRSGKTWAHVPRANPPTPGKRYDLRKRGHVIHSEIVERAGKRFARYRLLRAAS